MGRCVCGRTAINQWNRERGGVTFFGLINTRCCTLTSALLPQTKCTLVGLRHLFLIPNKHPSKKLQPWAGNSSLVETGRWTATRRASATSSRPWTEPRWTLMSVRGACLTASLRIVKIFATCFRTWPLVSAFVQSFLYVPTEYLIESQWLRHSVTSGTADITDLTCIASISHSNRITWSVGRVFQPSSDMQKCLNTGFRSRRRRWVCARSGT